MSINNKRSYTEYTVTQPTTDFAIGFDDFDEGSKDNILVTLNGVLVESLGYAAIRKNESTVTITPAITEGTVRLTRETDIDEPFHKFTAGALFSAKSMDENFQQVRHSQQEVRDGFVFLEYNTNGIVQASKVATAEAKAATVEATASAVRAETAADTAVQAVGSLQGVVTAATTATTNANAATATATTAASQATAATTSAQNATLAATLAKQEAQTATANANAATVGTLAAVDRANSAADVVADLVVGKVRAQDVSTVDGSTQDVKNTEFRSELDALPFDNGTLADTFVTATANGVGAVARTQRDVNSESVSVKDFGAKGDNVTDDTAAFKAAIAHARKTSTNIYVPAGRFLISERLFFGLLKAEDAFVQPTQSFNICTGIIGAGNDATFLVPTAALKGDVVLDLTGLRHKYLRDFTILSLDPVNCPAIGILTARFYRASIDAPTNNDWGEFQNVALHEYFSFAPYLAHATEMLTVNQCKFWTNHNDAIGAYAITSDLLETAPFLTEAVETEMKFTTGRQSNIYQKHIDCDYWLGSNAPTRADAAMVWIKGALMHKFIRPYFNNNGTNHDSVRYDRATGEPFSYGLTIQDACFHQITNCGLRIVCPNVATSYSGNNRTTKFIEAEIIIEGYTNGLITGWLDEDVHIHAPLHNSTIASCSSVNWKESHSIEGSHIGVRDAFVTDNTGAVASNKFTLEKGGSVSSIRGFYSAPAHNSAQEIIMGRSDGSALELASGVDFFQGDLLKVNHRVNSTFQFNYTSYYNNGRKEAAVRRGGWFEVHTPDGGFMLTAPDGGKWNIGVSNEGVLVVTAKP